MDEVILTQEELVECCKYWQEKLGLSHWSVAVGNVRAKDMPLKDCDATNEFNISVESAIISIMDSIDNDNGPFKQDMERTLVHELLHNSYAIYCATGKRNPRMGASRGDDRTPRLRSGQDEQR